MTFLGMKLEAGYIFSMDSAGKHIFIFRSTQYIIRVFTYDVICMYKIKTLFNACITEQRIVLFQ